MVVDLSIAPGMPPQVDPSVHTLTSLEELDRQLEDEGGTAKTLAALVKLPVSATLLK